MVRDAPLSTVRAWLAEMVAVSPEATETAAPLSTTTWMAPEAVSQSFSAEPDMSSTMWKAPSVPMTTPSGMLGRPEAEPLPVGREP